MADREPTRRDVLRTGAALLATGTAGCESILSDDTPTRSLTRTMPARQVTANPTRFPTPSQTPNPTDTPGRAPVLTRLSLEDGSPEDLFGFSTAVGSDAAFVGAPGTGAVYVFAPSGSEWTRTAKLTAEGASGDALGVSLALAGDTLLVGARVTGAASDASNSAHLFRRTDGAWRHAGRLIPGDGSPIDGFASAVALGEGWIVVGAPGATDPAGTRTGAAYAFERVDGEWRQEAKLAPGDLDANEAFGVSLASADGTLLVGAPGPSSDGDGTGSVYAFERADGEWRRAVKLVSGTAAPAAFFGSGLAIADGTAFVGAPGDDRDGIASGVTYVLERSGAGWQATAGLSPGADAGNRFGATVALSRKTALVAASPRGTGSVYAFDRSGGPWRRRAELVPDPPPVNGGFGAAIAARGETALIGAPYVFEEGPGVAYAADLTAL